MTDNWFKGALVVLLAVVIYEVSAFLNHIAWSYAYAQRGECLERIYERGNNDTFDSKANCFDIIALSIVS
jgi:hypothetical protein